MPSTFAARTLALNWTGIAYTSFCAIENYLFRNSSRGQWENLPLRTKILIFLRVILKEFSWVIFGALAEIRGREIGSDPPFFQSNNIGHGAIPGIAHSQLWRNPPPGIDPIHQIQDRCVVSDRGGSYQRAQYDAGFAPIDNIVITITQHSTTSTGRLHRGSVRINRGDPVTGSTLIMWLPNTCNSFPFVLCHQLAEGRWIFFKLFNNCSRCC